VGPDTFDDAAVIKLRDDLAICFTADFITPVVDDAFDWGRIAAANSISDIYAMGATPLCALNLVCWSNCLPSEMMSELLAGGADAMNEGGAMLVGGHTMEDDVPKYGLAVIGMIHPDKVLCNRGAKPGDFLYLSKPLGTGIMATAIKADMIEKNHQKETLMHMKALNKHAAEAAVAAGARALTDVTGFGLMGHLWEMLNPNEDIGVDVDCSTLPILSGAVDLAMQGLIPEGAYRNKDAFKASVVRENSVNDTLEMLCYDPQTSGGLLCAISKGKSSAYEEEAKKRNVAVKRIGLFNKSKMIRLY